MKPTDFDLQSGVASVYWKLGATEDPVDPVRDYLCEDLVQVGLDGGTIVDVGWYPAFSPSQISVPTFGRKMDARSRALKTWSTLKNRIRSTAPHLLEKIPPGITPVALAQFENALGLALPSLVSEMYLLHNGIGMASFKQVGEHRYEEPCDFLPIESLVQTSAMLNDLLDRGHLDGQVDFVRGPVRAVWWNRLWLPITSDGAGNHYCVDLDPAPGGLIGQVIKFQHDDSERVVADSDVASFLIKHLDVAEWAAREPKHPVAN